MPELPEVEVIRRELEPLIVDKVFCQPVLHEPKTVQYPDPSAFISRLDGCRVKQLERKGKYLLVELDRGILIIHLRMTGNLVYSDQAVLPEIPYLRAELLFNDHSALYFSDMRRFGRLWLVANRSELQSSVLKNVGPDIFCEVDQEKFLEMLAARKKVRIKALLLNQGFAAGMGNIYTDESLFRCRIHPNRTVDSLTGDETEKLYRAIQSVLQDGIDHGGTSFRDYRNARGTLGNFQFRLAVYGRKGEICRCGSAILKTRTAGRGTYYCPRCQSST